MMGPIARVLWCLHEIMTECKNTEASELEGQAPDYLLGPFFVYSDARRFSSTRGAGGVLLYMESLSVRT